MTAHIVVLDETATLQALGGKVGDVAAEKEQVPRGDAPREAHENQRVQTEGRGHRAGDDPRVLLDVGQRRNRNAPVGDRSPKVRAHKVFPELLALEAVDQLPAEGCHLPELFLWDGFGLFTRSAMDAGVGRLLSE